MNNLKSNGIPLTHLSKQVTLSTIFGLSDHMRYQIDTCYLMRLIGQILHGSQVGCMGQWLLLVTCWRRKVVRYNLWPMTFCTATFPKRTTTCKCELITLLGVDRCALATMTSMALQLYIMDVSQWFPAVKGSIDPRWPSFFSENCNASFKTTLAIIYHDRQ